MIDLGPAKIGQARYDKSVDKMFSLLDQLDKDSEDESSPHDLSLSRVSSHSMNDESFADCFTD